MAERTQPDALNKLQTGSIGSGASVAEARWTVRALLAWMIPFLTSKEVDSPRTVAEVLLSHVLRVERLRLYMEPERELATDELTQLRALVARAGRHEPVQYLVGAWPFFGRDFEVAPCTLIPRPCTELLVERGLAWVRERAATVPANSLDILDLCTGSGCIAISLALGARAILRTEGVGCRPLHAMPASATATTPALPVVRDLARLDDEAHPSQQEPSSAAMPSEDSSSQHAKSMRASIIATDIIPEAVELAKRNAARLGAAVDFRVGDLYHALDEAQQFDLIVSNPPYVTDEEYAALDRNVREYEPASALRGGADGLEFVRAVVAGAEKRLRSGGLLLVEIGWKHGDAVRKLGGRAGWRDVEVLRDGDGHERVLVACRA
ncbi:MAG: peptide chain release factor N(5)-glutamine methyltransferase [Limnohabitans sp.]|nr:peptide chain release factor N(5)-glutamine methyltransferase [Limnohabitans sp.]